MPETMAHRRSSIARHNVIAILALFVAMAPSQHAGAQVSTEIIPFVGSFVPLSDWGTLDEPTISAHNRFRQQLGVLAGLRARVTLSDALGVEATGAYVNSGWTEERQSTTGADLAQQIAYTLHGRIIMANLRATYRPRRSNLYGLGGIGYMLRGGRAWDEGLWSSVSAEPTRYNKSNLTAIVGAGLRAAANPRVSTDITVELHFHDRGRVARGFAFAGSNYSNGGLQTDLVITAGIPILIGGVQ